MPFRKPDIRLSFDLMFCVCAVYADSQPSERRLVKEDSFDQVRQGEEHEGSPASHEPRVSRELAFTNIFGIALKKHYNRIII